MANSTVGVRFTGDDSQLRRTMGNVEQGMGRLGSALGGVAGTVAGAFAINEIVDFGGAMLSLGGQLETMRAKVNTVFEDSAQSIRQWADENNEAFGVTDDQLAAMTAGLGDLLKPMGFSAEAAAGMSTDIVGLAGALSQWSGGTKSAAEVTEILQGALLGETDALQGLGIAISASDVEARLAAKGQSELTGVAREQAEALAIQELIFEKSTDAQKAWAEGGSEALASQNNLRATIGELQEELATALTPALTSVANFLAENLPGAIATAADFFTNTLRPAFETVVAWIRENWPEIQAVIANVMTQVQTVVSSVLEIVMTLWRNFGDNILAFIQAVWPPIQQVISGAMQTIRGVIETVMGLISGDWGRVWDGIKQFISGIWDTIVGAVRIGIEQVKLIIGAVLETLGGIWSGAWNGLKTLVSDAWTGIKTAVSSGVEDVMGFITGLPGRIGTAARGMFDGIRNSFVGAINGIIRAWNNLEFTIGGGTYDPLGAFGPSITVPAFTFRTPNIPTLHSGGIVPGPWGADVPILAQAGELVVPAETTRRMFNGSGEVEELLRAQNSKLDRQNELLERIARNPEGASMRQLLRAGG